MQLLAGQRVIGPAAMALLEALLRFFSFPGVATVSPALAVSALTVHLHGNALLAPSDPLCPHDDTPMGKVDKYRV